jgi:hypothetical protein
MSIQPILIGSYANDGTGDDLRTAFEKVNANFTELSVITGIANATNLPGGTGVFAQKNSTNLEFKSLTSTGSTVSITNTATTVNLETNTTVSLDENPELGGNLNLNGYYIYGGDAQTTVNGYSVPVLDGLVRLLMEANGLNVVLGSFLMPSNASLDMGTFTSPINNGINFGTID